MPQGDKTCHRFLYRIRRNCKAMVKHLFCLAILSAVTMLPAAAQRHEIKTDRIRTLQVHINGEWNKSPILHLGTNDYLTISFDDLTHEYCRYRYKIEPCNFDWTLNEGIFDSDYLKGETGDQPIETYEKSLNTTVLYTHYAFRFPNARTGVKLSGNYRLTIFDDDSGDEVAVVCFSVVDDKVPVSATATTDTDIDKNDHHQQIRFSVNPRNLRLSAPAKELKAIVLQNNRWDNAAIAPKSDFVTPSEIQWKYAKNLIFKAGNEYRKFELTNLHYGTMGIDKIRWFDPYYHAELYAGEDRKNYVYDEDQDGGFVVRTQESDDVDIQSDYVLVHFLLKREPLLQGSIYVDGAFCNNRFLPECKMEYNTDGKYYEATILLKQGYYNYQYLYVPDGAQAGETAMVEGDFYQTENKYSILIYFRPTGGRYDQLVGIREFRFMPGK